MVVHQGMTREKRVVLKVLNNYFVATDFRDLPEKIF